MHADHAGQPREGGEVGDDRALQPDVDPHDSSDPSVPSFWLTDFDGERAQRVDRLAADVDLHTHLALHRFTGPEYEKFRVELTRYGLDVIKGWLRNKKIFVRMRQKGWNLPEVDSELLDWDTQDELAYETVAKALHHFHHDVLLKKKWDPSRGARLTTFFVGQCLIRFANVYRDWMRHEMRVHDLLEPHEPDQMIDTAKPALTDPAWIAVARARIRRATRGVQDPRLRPVLELLAVGYTHQQVADELGGGLTPKRIERLLANHRDRLQTLGIA